MAVREAGFSERDLSGFKYLDRLLPMFERLHEEKRGRWHWFGRPAAALEGVVRLWRPYQ